MKGPRKFWYVDEFKHRKHIWKTYLFTPDGPKVLQRKLNVDNLAKTSKPNTFCIYRQNTECCMVAYFVYTIQSKASEISEFSEVSYYVTNWNDKQFETYEHSTDTVIYNEVDIGKERK